MSTSSNHFICPSKFSSNAAIFLVVRMCRENPSNLLDTAAMMSVAGDFVSELTDYSCGWFQLKIIRSLIKSYSKKKEKRGEGCASVVHYAIRMVPGARALVMIILKLPHHFWKRACAVKRSTMVIFFLPVKNRSYSSKWWAWWILPKALPGYVNWIKSTIFLIFEALTPFTM